MHAFLQDLKYGYRQLVRTLGFTVAAVFALALGIGANVIIFSTVDAVLINSLPFRSVRQPERLVTVYETNASIAAFLNGRLPVRLRNFLEWKKQADSFTTLEAYQDTHFDLTSTGFSNGEPEQVDGVSVTPGLLRLRGCAPARSQLHRWRSAGRDRSCCHHQQRALARPLSRRSQDSGPGHSRFGHNLPDHRRSPGRL